MTPGSIVILIVVIVVALLVIAAVFIAVRLGRKRRIEADRTHASDLRQRASDDALLAQERDAASARAIADAKQAEVEAERLRRSAAETQAGAQESRAAANDQLRRADIVDPDVPTNDGSSTGRHAIRETNAAPRADAGPRDSV